MVDYRRVLTLVAAAGATAGLPGADQGSCATSPDPILALRTYHAALTDYMNEPDTHFTDEEGGIFQEQLVAIERKVMQTQATTPAGALASLDWLRQEFANASSGSEHGDRFMLALVDSALGVMRVQAEGGAA